MHNPYYNNGGAHWGLWFVMIIAALVVFSILAWLVVSIFRQRDQHGVGVTQPPAAAGSDAALRILDERFARGEIEADEYTRRRDLLRGAGPSAPAG